MWDFSILRKMFTLISLRYFIIAGFAFLICYVFLKNKIAHIKIQLRFPVFKDYQREIIYSALTIIIFSFVPFLFLGNKDIRKHTTFYTDINQYGRIYFWLAFPLMLLMHDTYFYWTHRLMHHPKLFNTFHLLHHKSTNPSPWAAFAFHPLEAFVEVGIFVLFLLLCSSNKCNICF